MDHVICLHGTGLKKRAADSVPEYQAAPFQYNLPPKSKTGDFLIAKRIHKNFIEFFQLVIYDSVAAVR